MYDPGARIDLWRYLTQLRDRDGVTIVLTTHLLDEADRADRIAIMHQGRLAAMGEPLAWVYVVVMWVTVGNGLRYGNRYLYVAVAMAVASFGTVLVSNDFWAQVRGLGVGLLVGLAAVPLYLSSLLRQLTRATEEARRASEAKSRFLANMSHEFRTPLNGLGGMSELLATTRLDDEQRECVRTIQASTRTLMALVEDVLDISAIEAGKLKLNLSDFSPREVVSSIGLILHPQARAKNIDYLVVVGDGVPETVHGDPGHVRQVLLNLVGNALKFTELGSVTIAVSRLPHPDAGIAMLHIAVKDTGVGIAPADQARIFDAFTQVDGSSTRKIGGTGLDPQCPNCMLMEMRVGDSFVADANHFAEAAVYATDNGASIIQSALGSLNHTRFSALAVEYAYDHGVLFVASAADEV